jgi:acetyl-CoA C-acetyltransferase
MHGLANTVLRLRAGAGRVGWVSGLGMSATKHAVAALSNDARRIAAADGRSSTVTLPKDQLEGPALVDAPEGWAEIESYTLTFDRENRPEKSMLYLRLPDGRRSLANGEKSDALLRLLLEVEGVGVRGRVTPGRDGAANSFALA